MDREKITLHGVPETMLFTLYARALDSRSPAPVLGDTEAARMVPRIDYDFERAGMGRLTAAGIALRARQLDDWTRRFLLTHREATVLHLACGLDSRAHRITRLPTVRWIDVDLPEVLAIREHLLPHPAGDYRTLAASVTDEGWLEHVPADRPTVAVFEGLSMYLREEDGKRLLQRIVHRFPGGQLLFDCCNSLALRVAPLVPSLRRAGSRFQWAIDDPREPEGWAPGLRCLDALPTAALPGVERLPWPGRLSAWLTARVPGVRDMGRLLRYEFGG
ncbi:class I SAM-dependent methyltransferase [Streptomyces orinoci]|uniref:Class I SAM-dependent methyltransferase n=1 Tax=Streptomyces orinoci TaxID=67339 RepID=A0ABV3K2G2_STRON|nr:class I SAM-dependent methyltransferase [Streptomyces orinoci]